MKRIAKLSVPLLATVALFTTNTEEAKAESVLEANTDLQETNIESLEVSNDQTISPMVVPSTKPQMLAAWKAGTKIVREKYGHAFTADLMDLSVNPPSSSAYFNESSRAANLVKSNAVFKKILSDGSSKFSKTKSTNLKASSVFPSGELQTALNKFNYNINVEWNDSKKQWYYYGYITDTYDFVWSTYNNNYDGFDVTFANNFAAELMRTGVIQDFDIRIFVNGFY